MTYEKHDGPFARLFGALLRCPWKIFILSQGFSAIGSWATRVALSWIIFRLSGSVFFCGVIAFGGQIAILLLAPFAGYALDRFPRRNIVLLTQGLLLVQATALAGIAYSNHLSVPAIVALSILRGVIAAFDLPARQALLGDLTRSDDDTKKAQALDGLQINVARLLGPVVAGVLIPFSGEGLCFICDSLSYFFAIGGLLLIPTTPLTYQRTARQGDKANHGLVMNIKDRHALWRPLLLLGAISFFCVPFTVLLPQYVYALLNRGPATLSLLTGASGAGAILATLIVYVINKKFISITIMQLNCISCGLCMIIMSSCYQLYVSCIVIFILSIFIMMQISSTATLLQTTAAIGRRGRISTIYGVFFWGIIPSGSLVYGAFAQWLGPEKTLALAGYGCFATAFVTCLGGAISSFFEKNTRGIILSK